MATTEEKLTETIADDAINAIRALLRAARGGILTEDETLYYMADAFDAFSERLNAALAV